MAALIELKYFNTFWLKKIKTITDVGAEGLYPRDIAVAFNGKVFELPTNPSPPPSLVNANVGQKVTFTYTDSDPGGVAHDYSGYVVLREINSIGRVEVTLSADPIGTVPGGTEITFGKIINFDNIPAAYALPNNVADNWFIEESRIRGGYNNVSVDFGVKAYLVEDEPKQSHKFSGLIHSGVFNSRTGFNATNQFSVGEDITRTIDPANGSIQKLYAEDTNLIIFQESKVSKSLIDKDAIYSAEGNASVTSRNLVIGQNVAFGGEYGISTDPESFAVNGYRKYFTDRDQNVVCRLSMDGITPISNYGMTDFFRDKLSTAVVGGIKGGWDAHNKQYVVSIDGGVGPTPGGSGILGPIYNTLSFDESVKGWTSLFDYKPNQIFSLNNNYFTANAGKIYKHYTLEKSTTARGVFYGINYNSNVTLVFNGAPSMIKNFQTINYEGDTAWKMVSFNTNTDRALPITEAVFATTLEQMQNALLINRFKLKEDKYFGDLVNNTSAQNGEVVFGGSSSGVKGFFGEVKMEVNNANNAKKELFAVSTGFVQSS
tara:strand:- start:7619 stop:9250 length:1632 start_codon:yes stop_codon:yes gene_type:complete